MNGLDGCYCERTCSVKGVVYREDEGWTDGCRNCTCTVGPHTRVLLEYVCVSKFVEECVSNCESKFVWFSSRNVIVCLLGPDCVMIE